MAIAGSAFGFALSNNFSPSLIRSSLASVSAKALYLVSPSTPSRQRSHLASVDCPFEYIGIVGFGQSNIANRVHREISIGDIPSAFMYNWIDGKCYPLVEPLVGTDGTGGSVLVDMALAIRSKGIVKPILIAPIAKGGSSVFEWYGHDLKLRLNHLLLQSKSKKLTFKYWIWQQGESDANPKNIKTNEMFYSKKIQSVNSAYSHALNAIFDRVVEYNANARFSVSLTSICNPKSTLHDEVRDAQESVINLRSDTSLSLDTDKLGNDYRARDKCHFDSRGSAVIGEKYAQFIIDNE